MKIKNPLDFILFLLTCLIICGVFLQVLMRYIFYFPMSGVDEVVTQSFIFMVFIGALRALTTNQNIHIDAFERLIHGSAKVVHKLIINVLMLGFVLIVVVYGFQFAWLNLGQSSISLQVPKIYYYLVLPICCVFMSIVLVIKIIRGFWDLRGE